MKPTGNILIVDDNKDNLRVLVQTLTGQGYIVRPALNGELALLAAKREEPDLVLLDIMMPGMDGYQVCEQMKANEKLKEVPIIFISALTGVSDKIKGLKTGAIDYIRKPFHMDEVLARVEAQLTLRRLNQDLKQKNHQLSVMNDQLKTALDEIKTLRGILPICSYCSKIRDNTGYWNELEAYFHKHSKVDFSHSICPECAKEHFPDIDLYDNNDEIDGAGSV